MFTLSTLLQCRRISYIKKKKNYKNLIRMNIEINVLKPNFTIKTIGHQNPGSGSRSALTLNARSRSALKPVRIRNNANCFSEYCRYRVLFYVNERI
jgi:hypothetical protein